MTTTDKAIAASLRSQVEDVGKRFPKFAKVDEQFVLWFLLAYLTDHDTSAQEAICGGGGDKGLDAVLIDHAAEAVFIIQGKYREGINAKAEKRTDVIALAQLATILGCEDGGDFGDFLAKMEPYSAKLLKDARQRILKKGYRLWLYFVTTGRVSSQIVKDSQTLVRQSKLDAECQIIDGRRVGHILKDYLDGVAPPIPLLDLEMEAGAGVKVNGVMQRYDAENNIESWVFSMKGDAVAQLVDIGGSRVFARNIRGFLGQDTKVNKDMTATLHNEADHFFYYNNGITILCDHAKKESSRGRDVIRVKNPQIINGQQTTRSLAAHREEAAHASVLVKVISVNEEKRHTGFDDLVSRIVAGTNWQNTINYSDLMSNDRIQIDLERALRKLGYVYLRKRMTKGEARRLNGGKGRLLKKEECAQAVAGCELDPIVVRSGKENLFKDEFYRQVFPNADPAYFLPRYWTMQQVSAASKGKPARAYAKWMVQNLVWTKLSPLLRTGSASRAFRAMCEQKDGVLLSPLRRFIDRVFVASLRYYKVNKGRGQTEVDISQFFRNTKGHHKEFAKFWERKSNKDRSQGEAALGRVGAALESFER